LLPRSRCSTSRWRRPWAEQAPPGKKAARRFYLHHGFVVEDSICMTLDLDRPCGDPLT